MRFVSPDNSSSTRPFYGDSVCFVGERLRSYNSRDGAENNRKYEDYVRISATGDEWVLSSTSFSYRSSPCNGYAVYRAASLPSSVAGSAEIVTDAALCLALMVVVVWVCVRPIFPRYLFTRSRSR